MTEKLPPFLRLIRSSLVMLILLAVSMEVQAQGLVAQYLFNGNAQDNSGKGHHGTVAGSTTLTADRNSVANSAYNFSASTGSAITVPDSPDFNITAGMTVACWFKLNQTYGGHSEQILYQFKYPENVGWAISVNQDSGTYGAGNYGIQFQGNSVSATCVVPFSEVNKWIHVAGTYDGVTLKLYTNGVLAAQAALASMTKSATALTIGGSANPVSGAYSRNIDDVHIFNYPLTATEVGYFHANYMPQVGLVKAVTVRFSDLIVGLQYQLQTSTDLSNWSDSGAPFRANSTAFTHTSYWNVEDWGQLYFRLK
jgi:hypothetical protein